MLKTHSSFQPGPYFSHKNIPWFVTHLQVPGFLLAECPHPEVTSLTIWGFAPCLEKTFKFPDPMSMGCWSGLFSHVEEKGCCILVIAGDSHLTSLWWVLGLRSCWGTWIVVQLVWERIMSFVLLPPSCSLGSVRCLFCQAYLSLAHTPMPRPKYIPPMWEAHNFIFTKCCIYWDFSQVSIYDWARLLFKLENTSSLSQDFICICRCLNGLGMGWLFCASSPSDLAGCHCTILSLEGSLQQ